MEAIWDDKLSDKSYGLRPVKSLHQALFKLYRHGSNYKWVVKWDISGSLEKYPTKSLWYVLNQILHVIRHFN